MTGKVRMINFIIIFINTMQEMEKKKIVLTSSFWAGKDFNQSCKYLKVKPLLSKERIKLTEYIPPDSYWQNPPKNIFIFLTDFKKDSYTHSMPTDPIMFFFLYLFIGWVLFFYCSRWTHWEITLPT